MVSPYCSHVFYLAVLPTFLLLVHSDAEDIFREDPLGKDNVRDFSNRGWYSSQAIRGADVTQFPFVDASEFENVSL
jgi:hypothetical protein